MGWTTYEQMSLILKKLNVQKRKEERDTRPQWLEDCLQEEACEGVYGRGCYTHSKQATLML